jgi:hypothetical protein
LKYLTALAGSTMYSRRRFVYSGNPDLIRDYLETQGYSTTNVGSTEESVGFDVDGTTVRVDFDLIVNNQVVGKGMVFVTNIELTTGGDAEMAQHSLQLYKRLYKRFRER